MATTRPPAWSQRLRTLVRQLGEPLPLVSAATVVGLVWPSRALAAHVDLILAVLVAAVVLTIDPRGLRALVHHRAVVTSAVLLPLVTLLPLAIGLAAVFETPEREGLYALGLSSARSPPPPRGRRGRCDRASAQHHRRIPRRHRASSAPFRTRPRRCGPLADNAFAPDNAQLQRFAVIGAYGQRCYALFKEVNVLGRFV